jgi:glycosyltransferase involved in cell wall biosynthesis
MKICQLIPGSGGTFYCQNCLRDSTLVRELKREGHDVLMTPLYLPLYSGQKEVNRDTPVFFGGINVYLQQHFGLFRKTPRWLDRIFDSSWMLKFAAAQEGSTNAAKLGPMTLSMLEGRDGRQQKEFARLMTWLAEHEKPEVVHISNALLLGLAVEIRRVLDVPIVCSLQDEEPWVEAMPAPWRERCWDAMAANAVHVNLFAATSEWYAERMRERLRVPAERVTVVYPGVEVREEAPADLSFSPPTLGYLSRLNEAQGFGDLVEAFIELKQEPALKDLRLRATGGCTDLDRPFIRSLKAKLDRQGFADAVDFLSDFQTAHVPAFLRSLSVFSTPARQGEAFGIQLIDAMAMGVPVVQPRIGAYPEVVEATGGGILYDPADRRGLVEALRVLLCNPDKARDLGERGRSAVRERFNMHRMAQDMINVYTIAGTLARP